MPIGRPALTACLSGKPGDLSGAIPDSGGNSIQAGILPMKISDNLDVEGETMTIRNKIMNKIVKGLAVASLLMTAQLANADDLSVAEWKQEINQVFRPTVDAAFERWVVTDEAIATIERQPINAIRMYNLMRNIRYNEVWNDFIKRYPDSKNGRIAMCEYAKSETLLKDNDVVCTEKFVPNAAIMQKNTLSPENRNHEAIPKIINPDAAKKRGGHRNK